eukprot:TRINITY_DN1848_c1_g1_i3.p1 TRINITY_DN1848_c1_g1~~TRINITY_DN1848_c1_g1_i3.p1  ORF type:complete len:265 (-),score=67.87 TRINITY_DN1848_c1_g1_i3:114-908(-)
MNLDPKTAEMLSQRGFQRSCSQAACENKEEKFGEYKLCASCKMVCYCSRDCQKRAWKTHKLECPDMKAQFDKMQEQMIENRKKQAEKAGSNPMSAEDVGDGLPFFKIPWDRCEQKQIQIDVQLYFNKYQHGIVKYSQRKFAEAGKGLVIADVSTERTEETEGQLRLMYVKPEILSHGDFGAINENNKTSDLLAKYDPDNSVVLAFTYANYARGAAASEKFVPVMHVAYDPETIDQLNEELKSEFVDGKQVPKGKCGSGGCSHSH